jgi:PleD family two-component response regulator
MFMAAIAVAGLAMQAYGKYKAGKDAKAANQANAALMMEEAKYQNWRTQVRQRELKLYARQLIGRQRVAFAKAGVVVDKNTALKVVLDSARRYEEDKAILAKEGEFNVRRAQMGAMSALNAGETAMNKAYWGIGSTLLQGAGQAYQQGWFSSSK